MISYMKVLEGLSLPPVINECIAGAISPPLATFKAPAEWYGFPPALIPIWSDGSRPTYIGLWKHWFVDREPSFVKMYVSSNRLTIEVARTVEQLFALIAMMSISERDGVEPDLVIFAGKVGLKNLEQINSVSLVSGDDARGFSMIDQFKNETPMESVKLMGDYNGDFPGAGFDRANPWWEKSCSFEISMDLLSTWPIDLTKPAWIESGTSSKFDLFRSYLDDNNVRNAWLTLNSSGWSIRDAKMAISELELKAKNKQFTLLADAWLSIADEGAGGY